MKLIKKYWLLFLSVLLVLPAIWPLFRSDFFRMHDWLHVARLIELDVALKAGQFPARWAPDFGWGYGMPLFHFYSPLPYYLAELIHLIKVPAVWAIKTIFALNFLAGFYFMYLWAKDQWGKHGAILAATAFTYMPYRAVQFYVRGSLAELTATTFIPLFFYAAKKKNILLTAIAITGIFLSHNVIGLFALFFLPLYFLFYFKSWKKFLLSSLLAFGLSAFFILPAFFEKNFTALSNLTGGFFNYKYHFIYLRQLFNRYFAYGGSILGPEDDISFQLGWPHIILALPAGLIWLKNFKPKKKKINLDLTYVFLALLIAIFMMTFHSQFIWDKFSLLHLAQFPWRLLAFAATFIAFLSGSVFTFIKKSHQGLLAIIILLIISLNLNYFKPEAFSNPEDFYYTDRQKISAKTSAVLLDYLPKTANKPANETPPTSLFETQATITNLQSKAGYISFTSQTAQPTNFIFNQYFFPGWQALIENQPTSLQPDPQLGRIQLSLPSGEHQVKISLNKTQLQHWSDIISLLTWLGLAGYLLNKRYV